MESIPPTQNVIKLFACIVGAVLFTVFCVILFLGIQNTAGTQRMVFVVLFSICLIISICTTIEVLTNIFGEHTRLLRGLALVPLITDLVLAALLLNTLAGV